jgi:hypothetical protein
VDEAVRIDADRHPLENLERILAGAEVAAELSEPRLLPDQPLAPGFR